MLLNIAVDIRKLCLLVPFLYVCFGDVRRAGRVVALVQALAGIFSLYFESENITYVPGCSLPTKVLKVQR